MGYIEKVFAYLQDSGLEPTSAFFQDEVLDNLVHGDLYFCWAAVNDRFPDLGLTIGQVEQLLYEEGMLSADRYDIPRRYSKKWFPSEAKKALEDLSPVELRPMVDTVIGSKATTVHVPHEIEDIDELPF